MAPVFPGAFPGGMKTLAIVQARMGSTRLPGKVLADLAGVPLLARVLNRLRRTSCLDGVVVATTTGRGDDPLVEFCARYHCPVFRGSEEDVLDRFYQTARQFAPDAVLRITADCPLIEPEVNSRLIQEFTFGNSAIDYACSFLPQRTFPRGLDVEIVSFAALERAWREDQNPAWREHVTEYILHHPNLFALRGMTCEIDLSEHRWTVDTPEDLELMRRIYSAFGDDKFTWRDVLALLERHPDWMAINRHIEQKVVL